MNVCKETNVGRMVTSAISLGLLSASFGLAQQSTATQTGSGGGGSRQMPERVYETLHLNSTTQQNEQNELLTALRNMLDPNAKVFLVPSRNEILIGASAEQTVFE